MIEINLISQGSKTKQNKFGIDENYLLCIIPVLFGLLIFLHTYLAMVNIIKNHELRELRGKWKASEPQRKLQETYKKEKELFSADAKTIGNRISWSEKLNKLSLYLPSGIWFRELSFSSNKDLILKGAVVSLQKEEMALINKFISNLKNDTGFFKDFNKLELTSVQGETIGTYDVVNFTLTFAFKSK